MVLFYHEGFTAQVKTGKSLDFGNFLSGEVRSKHLRDCFPVLWLSIVNKRRIMKLKDFLKKQGKELPKKEITPELQADYGRITAEHLVNGCNAFIDEISNIEVGEPLERISVKEVIDIMLETNRIYQQQHPNFQAGYSQLAEAIVQKFGAKKIDEAKIEKVINREFKKGNPILAEIYSRDLAKAIVQALEEPTPKRGTIPTQDFIM